MSKTGLRIANGLRPTIKTVIVDAALYDLISARRAQKLIGRFGLRSA